MSAETTNYPLLWCRFPMVWENMGWHGMPVAFLCFDKSHPWLKWGYWLYHGSPLPSPSLRFPLLFLTLFVPTSCACLAFFALKWVSWSWLCPAWGSPGCVLLGLTLLLNPKHKYSTYAHIGLIFLILFHANLFQSVYIVRDSGKQLYLT